MISIIVSYSNHQKWSTYLEPSLGRVQRLLESLSLPTLDIIRVQGDKSIFENYNKAMGSAQFPIRAFIHEDVDLGDPSWIFKLTGTFASCPNTALIGMVGTTRLQKGNWWDSGREYIRGELFSGFEKANWVFKPVQGSEVVECVDGFFMAMNRNIPWDTNLRGFHCYDLDMSRTVSRLGHQIRIIGHKAHHIGEIRTRDGVDDLFSDYNKKWGLNAPKEQT